MHQFFSVLSLFEKSKTSMTDRGRCQTDPPHPLPPAPITTTCPTTAAAAGPPACAADRGHRERPSFRASPRSPAANVPFFASPPGRPAAVVNEEAVGVEAAAERRGDATVWCAARPRVGPGRTRRQQQRRQRQRRRRRSGGGPPPARPTCDGEGQVGRAAPRGICGGGRLPPRPRAGSRPRRGRRRPVRGGGLRPRRRAAR